MRWRWTHHQCLMSKFDGGEKQSLAASITSPQQFWAGPNENTK